MSGIWPGDVRCVVVLSFDVDGVSGAINRNPDAARLPSLMSMREYGPSVGAPRILDLLDEYGIKASFYIPGYVAETHETLVLDIKERGHEIAHHGYMHEPPASLSKQQEEEVLDKGIAIIERIAGERPVGYRSPSWELSEHSLSLLAERDFLYDSSLMGNDILKPTWWMPMAASWWRFPASGSWTTAPISTTRHLWGRATSWPARSRSIRCGRRPLRGCTTTAARSC